MPFSPSAPPFAPMSEPRQAIKVLLVDDEAYFRVFVGKVLKSEGICQVLEARDGQEAIAQFSAHRPKLVILDINMPRLGGIEALQEIRRLSPVVPIVMLTSISEESVVETCVQQGASYFIRKDVRADLLQQELVEMLRSYCPAANSPDASAQAQP